MILQVEGVSLAFGGLQALDDVTFHLEEGKILGLIGPNGAGKTTMFNVLNGVYQPDCGRVVFRGDDIARKRTYNVARLGVARTHQVVRPLSDLTVRDNTIVGACFGRHRLNLKEAGVVADRVLQTVGLDHLSGNLAASLNVAQKKRLELARALAAQPYLLLLDEVLAGLNPTEMSSMLQTIESIRTEGTSLIMIEHVMKAVMSVSDRVIVLDYGRLIASGTPAEVQANEQVIEAYLGDPAVAEKIREGV